jgi:hypothetical protein
MNNKNNSCQFCIGAKRPGLGHALKTCPFLRENECNYCHKKGHTAKFCIKKNTKLAVPEIKPKVAEKKEEQVKQVNKNNIFELLDEEELEQEQEICVPIRNGMNYAAALAKQPVAVVEKAVHIPTITNANKKISWAEMNEESDDEEDNFVKLSGIKRKVDNWAAKSWADSSSDEEDLENW